MQLSKLINSYYLSFDFKSLRDETKQQYQYFLSVLCATKIEDAKILGSINISDITTKMAKVSYEQWCERGIHMANHVMSVSRVVYNYAIHMEHYTANPFTSIKRRTPVARKVVWTNVTQKEDYGFQKYVAPCTKPSMGVYTPYSKHRLPKLARDIMNNASLPTELRLSDLRRTGTTEMVDAGVSMGNIMAVTGHTNPQSVKPYMKNTLASANLALNLRKKLTDE